MYLESNCKMLVRLTKIKVEHLSKLYDGGGQIEFFQKIKDMIIKQWGFTRGAWMEYQEQERKDELFIFEPRQNSNREPSKYILHFSRVDDFVINVILFILDEGSAWDHFNVCCLELDSYIAWPNIYRSLPDIYKKFWNVSTFNAGFPAPSFDICDNIDQRIYHCSYMKPYYKSIFV